MIKFITCYFIIHLLFLGFHRIQFSQRSSNQSRTRWVQFFCVSEWSKRISLFCAHKPFSEDTLIPRAEIPLEVSCSCVISPRLLLSPAHHKLQPRDGCRSHLSTCWGKWLPSEGNVFPWLVTALQTVSPQFLNWVQRLPCWVMPWPGRGCQDQLGVELWKTTPKLPEFPPTSHLSLPGSFLGFITLHLTSQCLLLVSSTLVNLVSLTGFAFGFLHPLPKSHSPFLKPLKFQKKALLTFSWFLLWPSSTNTELEECSDSLSSARRISPINIGSGADEMWMSRCHSNSELMS